MIFIGRFLAGFGTGYVLKHVHMCMPVVYNYIYRNEAFGYPCQNMYTTMEERESLNRSRMTRILAS